MMIPLPLHQQTTSKSAAAGVGGAECDVHYFEFAEQSHRASFSRRFKLERNEEEAASSAAMPMLTI